MTERAGQGSLAVIDVVILCGGLGSRLRAVVPDRPKALALVGGRPFLDILIDDILRQGLRRVIFCVGHLKEQIIARYRTGYVGEFLFSQENMPLGTGGALKNALPLIRSDPILVVNGDSYCPIEFGKLYRYHVERSAAATVVLASLGKRRDGGLVDLNEDDQILSFAEKDGGSASRRFINAGIYLINREVVGLESLTPPFSLECDVFPSVVAAQPCYGFVAKSPLIDIGTPDRYYEADELWKPLNP
jgi:NDP-sugar pyrophosphorylase family protein